MGLLGACYLTFSLVVYRYCGVWIASPALGSAGPLIKKVAYGIALPGLWISATLCQHVGHPSPRFSLPLTAISLPLNTFSSGYCEVRRISKAVPEHIGQRG